MKKTLEVLAMILALLFVAGASWAQPFLVCKPVTDAESYLVKIDGAADPIEVPGYQTQDNKIMIHYDLAGYTNGSHHLEVASKNMWGQSEYVPFDFIKQVPGNPLGIGLSAE